MRIKWMLAGVGGLSAATASASATLNWQTVLGPNSNIDGSGTLTEVDAVVTSPTGDVGVIGKFDSGSGPESAVMYVPYSVSNSPPVTLVVDASDTYHDVQQNQTYALDNFDNLTITGNTTLGTGTRLTFVSNAGPNTIGIFQYDVGGSGLQPVAFSNDTYNGNTLVNQLSLAGTLAMQVNQQGQAFFATGTASSNNVLLSGNSSSLPTATTQFKDGDNSLTLSSVANRVGISGDLAGTGVATLSNSGVQGIYAVSGDQTKLLSGTYTNPSLLATASGATGVSASLFLATDPTNAGQMDVVLNQGGNLATAGTNTTIFTGPSGGGSPTYATAEVTPDGKKIAAFVPDANGGTLQYYNAGAALPAAVTIASTSSAVSLTHSYAYDPATNQTDAIASLQTYINAPMINSKGIVVFDVMVNTDAFPSGTQALLEWQPNDANPIILLAAGDTVDIDGAGPQVIQAININGLDTENDFFKNSLSDGDYLAVDVYYGDNSDQAVIITNLDAVPEPTTACIIPLAGAALLARRRRRRASSGQS